MTTALPKTNPASSSTNSETRILLQGVSWETYERLLAETDAGRHHRIADYDGILEITAPLEGHEELTRLFDQFLVAIVDELELEFRSLGSLTMKNAVQKKGLEPDGCFYIQHESVVQGIDTLDFAVHPPPDLVVEVDNSNSSLNKLPIYAALRIPEIWRLQNGVLTIYQLNETQSDYAATEQSLTFPQLPIRELPQFIEQAKTIGQRAAVRSLKERVRQIFADRESPSSEIASVD
ncbi:MAG: Uma2 family endonuclease [Cyanobacteria bacterium P01_D01_bin.115]